MTTFNVRVEEAYVGTSGPAGQVEVGDDELLLDSEFRGANRVVVAIATPIEETHHCGVNGCSREVDSADAVCWQHEE